MSDRPLLSVRDLRVRLRHDGRESHPVDGVSFDLEEGHTVGLVGESGCGKSMTALALLRLVPQPAAQVESGEVWLHGRDLLALREDEMQRVRGNEMAMVFQEPMTSLNPVYSCGEQIAEVLRLHRGMTRKAAWQRTLELLDLVQIPDPARRGRQYPHEMSGGMRQRVMIAMAIACEPSLLIADEPTTALDVTIQKQILELLDVLQSRLRMGVLHITHDLAVIAERAHHILVMYAGRIVESAPVGTLFRAAAHPYTLGLLACRPVLGGRQSRLPSIPGRVPDPASIPSGCRFRDRCPFAVARCAEEDPSLLHTGALAAAACWEWERVRREGRWPVER